MNTVVSATPTEMDAKIELLNDEISRAIQVHGTALSLFSKMFGSELGSDKTNESKVYTTGVLGKLESRIDSLKEIQTAT